MMGGRCGGKEGWGGYGRHLAHRLSVDEVLVTPAGGVAEEERRERGVMVGGRWGGEGSTRSYSSLD